MSPNPGNALPEQRGSVRYRSVFLQTVRIPSSDIDDTVPRHHCTPEELRILGIQSRPPHLGIRTVRVAVGAIMCAGVVIPDIDGFHASASVADGDILRLVGDVEGVQQRSFDASALGYPVMTVVLLGAAAAQSDAVLLCGPGGHPAERVLLLRGRSAEQSRIDRTDELPVDVEEAEDASVGPFRCLPAHHPELALVISRIDAR